MKAGLVVLAAVIGAVCTTGTYKTYNTPASAPHGPTTYTTTPYNKNKGSAPAAYGNNNYMKAGAHNTYNYPPANYQYKYRVHDDYPPGPASAYGYGGPSYSNIPLDFGAEESRKGDYVKGSYDVLLPDGKRETVNYYVDGYSGFVADVKFTQEVNPSPYAMGGSNNPYTPAAPYVASSMTPYISTPYTATAYTSNSYPTTYSTNPYTTNAYTTNAYTKTYSAPHTTTYVIDPPPVPTYNAPTQ